MRNNRKRFPVLLAIIFLWAMVACLPGDSYEAYTWTPEPRPTATIIPMNTPTPSPTFQGPTPTIGTGGTPGATPIGGEPTPAAVNLDCPKMYTAGPDSHLVCIVEVTTRTPEMTADGPTGDEFLPPGVLPIDMTVSEGDRCVLRGTTVPDYPAGYSWVNCNHVQFRAIE